MFFEAEMFGDMCPVKFSHVKYYVYAILEKVITIADDIQRARPNCPWTRKMFAEENLWSNEAKIIKVFWRKI